MARGTLCKEVADSIRQDIIKGIWKPGDRLPGEYEFAEKYNVSRFTVREAIKTLHSSGLICVRRGIGTYVSDNKPESYMPGLLSHMVLERQDIKTICEARLPIESQTVALCAKKANTEVAENLWRMCNNMNDMLKDTRMDEYNRLDLAFHLYIAEVAGNSILYEMLRALQEFLIAQMNETIDPRLENVSIVQHRQIVQAIEANDAELATLMMQRHIQKSIQFAEDDVQNKDMNEARD